MTFSFAKASSTAAVAPGTFLVLIVAEITPEAMHRAEKVFNAKRTNTFATTDTDTGMCTCDDVCLNTNQGDLLGCLSSTLPKRAVDGHP